MNEQDGMYKAVIGSADPEYFDCLEDALAFACFGMTLKSTNGSMTGKIRPDLTGKSSPVEVHGNGTLGKRPMG